MIMRISETICENTPKALQNRLYLPKRSMNLSPSLELILMVGPYFSRTLRNAEGRLHT